MLYVFPKIFYCFNGFSKVSVTTYHYCYIIYIIISVFKHINGHKNINPFFDKSVTTRF